MCVFINPQWCIILTQSEQILSQERLFRDVFETLQVKRPRSETAARKQKTETFQIPRVIYVSMSSKEAIFDGLSTKEDIVDYFPVDNEDNIEEGVSEVTVLEIGDLRNECMRET